MDLSYVEIAQEYYDTYFVIFSVSFKLFVVKQPANISPQYSYLIPCRGLGGA